jgi:hypothetical protein
LGIPSRRWVSFHLLLEATLYLVSNQLADLLVRDFSKTVRQSDLDLCEWFANTRVDPLDLVLLHVKQSMLCRIEWICLCGVFLLQGCWLRISSSSSIWYWSQVFFGLDWIVASHVLAEDWDSRFVREIRECGVSYFLNRYHHIVAFPFCRKHRRFSMVSYALSEGMRYEDQYDRRRIWSHRKVVHVVGNLLKGSDQNDL